MEIKDEHLDPTSEISLETVKNRTVKGIVTLTGRYFVLYIITLVAQGFLGALLTTSQFGIFGIVSAIVNFLVYFSDIGLAASLIQKKEKLTSEDLKTTFTVQQFLVLLLLVILFMSTPFIKGVYGLDQSGIYLLYALGVSFLMSSLKTIPSVILERNLRFEILAVSNILENLVYNVSLVYFAWKGFGITSFTISVLLRGITGLITIYLFQPWKPSFALSGKSLSSLLKFGLPYQLNTFIAVLKDDGLTLVLGKFLGMDALGILVWAQKWIQVPLRVVLDNVTRVTFPAFARMQDDKRSLEKSATRSIFFTTLLVFPMVAGIVILAPIIIALIPKYSQWMPAVIPLTFLSINVFFAAVTTQLTNLLNAIGKIKITSFLMIMWTVLTWALVPYLGRKYGVNGASFGYSLVGVSSIIAIIVAKKYVNFSIWHSMGKPFFGLLVMTFTLLIMRRFLPVSAESLIVLILAGSASYFAAVIVLIGKDLVDDIRRGFSSIFKK